MLNSPPTPRPAPDGRAGATVKSNTIAALPTEQPMTNTPVLDSSAIESHIDALVESMTLEEQVSLRCV